MQSRMASCTQADQVFFQISAAPAAELLMVNFEVRHAPTYLAPPIIPAQDLLSKLVVGARGEANTRIFIASRSAIRSPQRFPSRCRSYARTRCFHSAMTRRSLRACGQNGLFLLGAPLAPSRNWLWQIGGSRQNVCVESTITLPMMARKSLVLPPKAHKRSVVEG